ncbi:MAG: rRNA ((1402)-N(4))-methyltransferase [Moraxellaceae bacterium]|jgi:16S rRNA (cytosine1402-N4)-methyltransferase|nr:rRNA ((1402)-N(4))-methyltransferase [Moraxellaceae bacterium]
MSSYVHQTVLLDEAVVSILGAKDGVYVDATFGRGGHTRYLLARLSPEARVLGFDKDPEAIAAGEQLAREDSRFAIIHASFAEILSVLKARGLAGTIDGVLADLGVSSPQLDDAGRGFSFLKDGPLDMRMDTTRGPSAAEWLAAVAEGELARVLFEYGEERYSRRIARALVKARAEKAITRTKELADIVAAAHPAWEKHKHPATRAFQAIRIAINSELGDIETFLRDALAVLKPGGRLAVISFHSLEDRLVKQFFQKEAKGDDFPAGLPVTVDMLKPRLKIVGKAIEPSAAEVDANPRARSARLRVAEKIAEAA